MGNGMEGFEMHPSVEKLKKTNPGLFELLKRDTEEAKARRKPKTLEEEFGKEAATRMRLEALEKAQDDGESVD